jgi:cytochrome c biogenesis protein CcdA
MVSYVYFFYIGIWERGSPCLMPLIYVFYFYGPARSHY